MNDKTVADARKKRKEEARLLKRKRIEESGGVRPRSTKDTSRSTSTTGIGTSSDKDGRTTASPSSNPKRMGFGTFSDGRHYHGRNKKKKGSETKHRFGAVMEEVPCPNISRNYTISMAVPGSVVSNAQTRELRTQLVGQIARAAAIYHVDEIIVFDDLLSSNMRDNHHGRSHRGGRGGEGSGGKRDYDRNKNKRTSTDSGDKDGAEQKRDGDNDHDNRERYQSSDPHTFMARVLQYIDCPQYLRRSFFPMHGDLQFAGLLPPLDAPHHVRAGEKSTYREGVVLDKTGHGPDAGSLVNCGIRGRPVEIDRALAPGIRCTVQLDTKCYDAPGKIKGVVVSPTTPREEDGTYWGYTTRLATSIKAVFDECPYEGGYDLKVGTSERGDVTVDDKQFAFPKFKHLLVIFGGVAGIEECIDADESMTLAGKDSRKLFDLWVNICPYQGSRTIRTEEAVLIALARFRPHIAKNGDGGSKQPHVVKDEDLNFSDGDNLSEESSDDEVG
eukprot:CAMPEP_0178514608 /NCGR_PEP_ID=MMETSP0696-20121128/24105_1 /TAXON_ID=265572 /ORGANISM="Extubocellulus spinifer, Strain CCMP396" /LENGTH=499 /DNA_ID=CAMNT_0020144697 /DNA_START=4 /DNA_END=1503 /DNA_ORIENTATION=-